MKNAEKITYKSVNIHSFNRVIRLGGHDFFFALLEQPFFFKSKIRQAVAATCRINENACDC